ncbi:hypothetical protein, partial [Thioalkalivibrio sp.]|uniref:hypothetical protein n=1 Tax=Thioalkalivibrio sp. TaxID=2093813 RepID=UPI0025F659CA
MKRAAARAAPETGHCRCARGENPPLPGQDPGSDDGRMRFPLRAVGDDGTVHNLYQNTGLFSAST